MCIHIHIYTRINIYFYSAFGSRAENHPPPPLSPGLAVAEKRQIVRRKSKNCNFNERTESTLVNQRLHLHRERLNISISRNLLDIYISINEKHTYPNSVDDS